ncbi:hydroxyproline O-galactosyltransferase HPGT1-like protein [Tanacetum coccineum]
MLQAELDEAKKEGFVSKHLTETKGTDEKKKLLAVVGILTGFGRRHNRDAIRKAWMPTGRIPFPFVSFILTLTILVLFVNFTCEKALANTIMCQYMLLKIKRTYYRAAGEISFYNINNHLKILLAGTTLKKMEDEKGVIIRFVIGKSSDRGDSSDTDISNENKKTHDFLILNDHVETPKEQPKKTKLFFGEALQHWDAEFYVKVNDDIYLNIDALGAILSNHVNSPRAYIGCMKSGGVYSKQSDKWYEPEWWKFGDKKSYFRHASGEIFAVSRALAQFISINRSILRTYAHDDVSVGSWFIGLDVNHVDEGKFCCSSWSSGAICAAS